MDKNNVTVKYEIQNLVLQMRDKARNILPKDESCKTIYHYTTLDGLRGIVETSQFWFSALHALNDSTEVSYLWDLIETKKENILEGMNSDCKSFVEGFYEYIKKDRLTQDFYVSKKLPDFINIFSVSFTIDEDSLPIWRGYAGDKRNGCRIEFDEKN